MARVIERLVTCFGEQFAERRKGGECEIGRLGGREPTTQLDDGLRKTIEYFEALLSGAFARGEAAVR